MRSQAGGLQAIACVMGDDVPVVAVRGHGATARIVAIIATRRRTTVAVVANGIVCRSLSAASGRGDIDGRCKW